VLPAGECKLYAFAFGEPPQKVAVDATLRGVVNVVHEHLERLELAPPASAAVPDVH
jgi:hypothetical protein